jgi:xanthine dehydrogenase accessory factor
MRAHFFERIATLERENAVFAIATVVARRAPVSSHLGDRALIFADGHMEGFVGGSCSRDIVRRQALGAIASRQPVLLQIRHASSLRADDGPRRALRDAQAATREAVEAPHEAVGAATERVVIPMSCASEGAVDVYIEPRLPLRRLVVIGLTPVAEALATVAATLDFAVARVVVDDDLRDVGRRPDVTVLALGELREFVAALTASERRALIAIVATQGHYDELALELLDAFDIAFTGLVASRRRAANVFGVLAQQGLAAERLAMIRNPVGLDIGARTPGDVAVSILAEIIANSPSPVAGDAVPPAVHGGPHPEAMPETGVSAVDPICGMDVDIAGALYTFEHAGRSFYFCCAGCRATFSADPARHLIALGSA